MLEKGDADVARNLTPTDLAALASNKDIKTTAELYPSVGPQLAAYANAWSPKDANTMQRVAVQLKGDGTYVAKPYTDPADFPLFCSLLTLRNWCARNSITPNFQD